MRRNVSVVLLALLFVPNAAAWPWDAVVVTVADSRVGDQHRFAVEEREGAIGAEERSVRAFLTIVESPTQVEDRYGIPRDVEPWLSQWIAENGTLESTDRCFALEGGNVTVRRDPIGAESWGYDKHRDETIMGVKTGSARSARGTTTQSTFFDYDCEGRNLLGGRSFREGEVIRFASLAGWGGDDDMDSDPARATKFHGRDALEFTFDLSKLGPEGFDGPRLEGELRFTVAQGLPGIPLIVGEASFEDEGEKRVGAYRNELVGFEQGNGPPLARQRGEVLPSENPAASFMDFNAGSVPDEAFEFPFSFAEAMEAITTDPQTSTGAWLRAHPNAIVVWVWYSRDTFVQTGAASSVPGNRGEREGTWWIGLEEGRAAHTAITSRAQMSPVDLPMGLTRATAYTDNYGFDVEQTQATSITTLPERSVDSRALVELARAHGIAKEEVRTFSYGLSPTGDGRAYLYFSVADVDMNFNSQGEAKGKSVQGSAEEGSVMWISNERRVDESTSILGPSATSFSSEGKSMNALSALAGPGIGAGLAGGAALTGLALLVVAVKFLLFPLFTRLKRDRLLDNPVRARLYERARLEPGIHRAELVDFVGIGEGATRHHLDQLTKNHLLVELKDGGFVRYYASGEVPPEAARREAALRAGSARAVYDLLASEPHLSLREAGARLGMSAPSVHKAKKKLEKAGLLPAAATSAAQVAEA